MVTTPVFALPCFFFPQVIFCIVREPTKALWHIVSPKSETISHIKCKNNIYMCSLPQLYSQGTLRF